MNGKFFLYPYQEGQVVTLKRTHPCGGKTWKLLRVGAEVLMVCETCGHKMTLKRAALEKASVAVTEAGSEGAQDGVAGGAQGDS